MTRSEQPAMAGEVIEVAGLVDDRWAARIAEAIDATGGDVVIDLSDAILVSRSPLSGALLDAVDRGHDLSRIAIVCPRVSAAMLLKRWRITDQVAVCRTPEELDRVRSGPSASHPVGTIDR